MSSRRQAILSMIKQQVKEIDPNADIILYGSRARGDEKSDSDWDILILINGKADIDTEKVFRHRLYDLELELGEAFPIFVYNKEEWKSKYWMTPFYKNISLEGVAI